MAVEVDLQDVRAINAGTVPKAEAIRELNAISHDQSIVSSQQGLQLLTGLKAVSETAKDAGVRAAATSAFLWEEAVLQKEEAEGLLDDPQIKKFRSTAEAERPVVSEFFKAAVTQFSKSNTRSEGAPSIFGELLLEADLETKRSAKAGIFGRPIHPEPKPSVARGPKPALGDSDDGA